MSFEEHLLPILRCQRCCGEFDFSPAPAAGPAAAGFGVLRCRCSEYPVVDGVPILLHRDVGMFEHTTGALQVAGVAPGKLVVLIKQGRSADALRECLAFPLLPPLLRRMLGWKLSSAPLAMRFARRLGCIRVHASVISRRDTITAVEAIKSFYEGDSPLDRAVGDYFSFRFAQPRHIAALSLLENVPDDRQPLLDLACGCGHLDHYLTSRQDQVRVVGMDMNFFHVWIARHWIAPGAQYVCAATDARLPFADGSFSATLCSDAYHYLPHRRRIHEEIERCAPGRFGVLTRVGNADVMPNEGIERTISGYLEEIGACDARVWAEETLVQHYLSRRNPLVDASGFAVSSHSKWLSFAWNLPARLHSSTGEWPHAAGELGLNSIYRCKAAAHGGMELVFEFPGVWYAYENGGMLAYHPRRVTLSEGQLEALIVGRCDPSFPELVSKFVMLGLPRRFAPPCAELRRFADTRSRGIADRVSC